jgi:hypothetical protein
MTNGFGINISEAEFKARSEKDQNWILFQGVSDVGKCIADIEEKGCDYGKKRYKSNLLKIISAISGGITFALGVVYIIYQMTCR